VQNSRTPSCRQNTINKEFQKSILPQLEQMIFYPDGIALRGDRYAVMSTT
jgi:hypothetical protein